MRDIKWIFPTADCIVLLEHIKKIFYDSNVSFMQKRYE